MKSYKIIKKKLNKKVKKLLQIKVKINTILHISDG